VRRREFIAFLSCTAIAGPGAAIAQSVPKVVRLGTLTPTMPLDEKTAFGSILLKELDRQGYSLGKNLSLDARAAAGDVRKLPKHWQVNDKMKAQGRNNS
jgi:putative tryptophan/tyrosine transport system substrate-binding protein